MKLELDSNNMLKGGILDLSGMTFRKIVEYFEIGDVDDLFYWEGLDKSTCIYKRSMYTTFLLDIIDRDLCFHNFRDIDSSRLALAYLLEICGCSGDIQEKRKLLKEEFKDGITQLVLSTLVPHKYLKSNLDLTEKGKMLLFLLRNYVFADESKK